MKKIISNKIVFFFSAVIISAYVMLVFVKLPGINGYEAAMFHDMVYGKAWKPYVYRTLLPTATRVITSVVPGDIQRSLSESAAKNDFITAVMKKFKWENKYLTEYLIACLLMYLSLLGFFYSFRLLFKELYTSPEWFRNIISLFAVIALPVMFKNYSYLYDFLSLFFFTLGLILMFRKKWMLFLGLFFISCFNKETTILLTLIFVIHYFKSDRLDKNLYKKIIAVQLLIFLAVKAFLFIIFMDNGGAFTEFHLINRNYILWNGYSITTLITLLVIVLLVYSRWNEKPQFLKDSLWIAVPLFIFTLLFGIYDELRDYYEVYPVLLLLIVYSTGRIIGVDIEVLDRNLNKTSEEKILLA